MKTNDIEIAKLKEYANNPRCNEKAVEKVAASIKEFGFLVPIVIDTDNVIVCGHTRVKAARLLGLHTVPCVVADELTPEQIKAFRVADNKTAELAEWDFGKLETELAALAEMGFDMAEFGFEIETIEIDELDRPDEKTGKVQVTVTFENVTDYEICMHEIKNTIETNNGTMAVKML